MWESKKNIVCFGGSSTKGDPFPEDWPHSYPSQLEARLRRDGRPDAVTFNLGLPAGTIIDITQRMAEDLEVLRPTHVVLYSIGNNVGEVSPERFRAELHRFIDLATPHVPHLLLVEEQDFDLVYGWVTHGEAPPHNRILKEVADERGIPYFSPRAAFQAEREHYLFIDQNGHLTKYGYGLLSRLIAERFEASGVLPPTPHPDEAVVQPLAAGETPP